MTSCVISPSPTNTIIIQPPDQTTVVIEQPPTAPVLVVYSKGEQGIQGIAGDSANTLSIPTNSIISAHKVVYVDSNGFAAYASADNLSTASQVIGVTLQSVSDNSPVSVQGAGEVVDNSWNWQAGLPLYLGLNGSVTQQNDVGLFLLQLGNAISSTKIVLNIKLPFIRG